ncbi:MAG: adenylate kinase [Thermoplasmata archaeon]|nr:MAG: adenylate kinase [Thermoplasmata archaeon]RLF45389.1 MAG: adenylate kinase [Thermoplasmata archaeon]RLF49770.1 MAG: adenylate kinase [Thermoplasmata archaeon]
MVVILAGVPGAGKTTVMKKVMERKEVDFITYGTVMLEIAKEMGIRDRDEMRKIPIEKQRKLQELTAEKVSKMGDVVVDTHCTIKTPSGYLPGFPYHILKKLNPRLIILIEADANEITERRAKDKDIRRRDEESIYDIEEHQLMNRIAAMNYAVLVSATVKIVKNNDGMAEKAAEEIIKVL